MAGPIRSFNARLDPELLAAHMEALTGEPAGDPLVFDLRLSPAPVRSVESAFRIHRQGTPLAHLRSSRIRTARQALLSSPLAPVSSVAHASGFARVETFAAHYFKAFGERPEETRARALRESGPPPPRAQEDVRRARVATLSARQQEVCALVVRGLLNKQVAAELGLSERTVKEYRAQAMAKLGVTSLAELVGFFRDAGATEGA